MRRRAGARPPGAGRRDAASGTAPTASSEDRLDTAGEGLAARLMAAQAEDPLAPQVWRTYGALADLAAKRAGALAAVDPRLSAALQARADDWHALHRRAPVIVDALARLAASAGFGRALLLGRLAACFDIGGRTDLALAHVRQAIDAGAALDDGEQAATLLGALQAQHGRLLRAAGRHVEAGAAWSAALETARRLGDLRVQGESLFELGEIALVLGEPVAAGQRHAAALHCFDVLRDPAMAALALHRLGRSAPLPRSAPAAAVGPAFATFETTLHDDLIVDYVVEPDLLLDRPRLQRVERLPMPAAPLAPALRPLLAPGVRTTVDDSGALRFCLPSSEPAIERQPGCTVMQRRRREVAIAGASSTLWRLTRAVDGVRSVEAIVAAFVPAQRATAGALLAALAASGVLDVSGRPIARYVHAATKKGVLGGGGLEDAEALRLATDGARKRHDDAVQLALGTGVPDRLRAFHALTRSRRSRRDYDGRAVARGDFDALLHTACGVTGTMRWAGRELKLRAYPSSGALYAVDIYPVVFRVAGLDPAVYHYRADDDVLERLEAIADRERFVAAALPVERATVGGAAAMICLVGSFQRHEQKYGQGGYRMMVAEAGCVAQNVVLAATALGLAARPFGGVFDDLVNEDLGLDGEREQFLLAVLVGHAGSGAGAPVPPHGPKAV